MQEGGSGHPSARLGQLSSAVGTCGYSVVGKGWVCQDDMESDCYVQQTMD